MFGLGVPEMLIVGVVAVLLFGHRLPSVMKSIGQGVKQFKSGLNDTSDDHEEAPALVKKDA